MSRRPRTDAPMRGADRVLEDLRATGPDSYRADPHRTDHWIARCPSCAERRLSVVEHGSRVSLTCEAGCPVEKVLTALRVAAAMYPRTWPDDRECPVEVQLVAEALLAQAREQRSRERQQEQVVA